MKLFELIEDKGILNRGTQQHRVKTKYHRPSQDKIVGYDNDSPLESALDKVHDIRRYRYTKEEQEALINAGFATHTIRDAKQLARDGEYPVEDFQISHGNVKVFYWPNRENGKPYTVWAGEVNLHEKERVDEVLPLVPLAITAARLAAPHVVKNLPKLAKYGKKAWDYGKKFLNPDVAKKTKGALHGLGSKAHAAGEVGKKIVKKSPPDSSTPDALKTSKVGYGAGEVDPRLATAAKNNNVVAGTDIEQKTKPPTAVGPMSPLERKRLR